MNKKNTFKKVGSSAAGFASAVVSGVVLFVFGNKPDVVSNPCYRSSHRADGYPKKVFDKAWKANWQSVKQLVCYGEVCNPYQVGRKFYTGHSRKAWVRNINIFK